MDTIAHVIARTDHFRAPPFGPDGTDGYKEWHHFCIMGPDVQAILNFNLSYQRESPGTPLARVVVLVRDHTWDGDVDTLRARDVVVRRGQIDAHFGHNHVCFQDGMFDLSVALENRPVALTLRLEPVAFPLMRGSTPIGEGKISWLVVPRLAASGTIVTGERVYRLEQVPAYHDHNWGNWRWGHDFAWQWGFALPDRTDVPWSLVFDQVTDRARNRAMELRLAFLERPTDSAPLYARRDSSATAWLLRCAGAPAQVPAHHGARHAGGHHRRAPSPGSARPQPGRSPQLLFRG
ncbi:MAG: hypothetical protein M5R40_17150 [Anaerolineae bacterium]|nr:hypothetical protein [Anaerolineae bacterium]